MLDADYVYMRSADKKHTIVFGYNETKEMIIKKEKHKTYTKAIENILNSDIKIEYNKNNKHHEKRWKVFINNKHKLGIKYLEENTYEVYSVLPNWKLDRFTISNTTIESFKKGIVTTKFYN